jgi:hypothetical protein
MVDGINGATAATATPQASFRTRLQDVTAAVAKELGMSTDDLNQALRAGQSLDDIAQSKGVSHDDLIATISQALQSTATSGQSTDPTQLTQLAERVAGAKGHRHHHHHRAEAVDGAAPQVTDPAIAATDTSGNVVNGGTGTSDPNVPGVRLDTRA